MFSDILNSVLRGGMSYVADQQMRPTLMTIQVKDATQEEARRFASGVAEKRHAKSWNIEEVTPTQISFTLEY